MPLTITISYQQQCPPVQPACGGDLDGRWFYTAACVDNSYFAQASQACPGITVNNITGTTRGEMNIAAGVIARNITTSITGTLSVPASCAIGGCATVQTALANSYNSATCTPSGGGCQCTVVRNNTITDSTSYVASGGTVTVGGGARTYAYCRTGNTVVYRETSTPMTEPGTITIERQ
jgi:hypothetical protein